MIERALEADVAGAAQAAFDEADPQAPIGTKRKAEWLLVDGDACRSSAADLSRLSVARVRDPDGPVGRLSHAPDHADRLTRRGEAFRVPGERKDRVQANGVLGLLAQAEVQSVGRDPKRARPVDQERLCSWGSIARLGSDAPPLAVLEGG